MKRMILALCVLLGGHGLIAQISMMDISYPAHTQQVTLASGLSIAYVSEGPVDAPMTLVMVHGLGSNLKCWQKNIAELSGTYRCVALDLPGYGRSGKGDYAFDIAFFAAALQEFIQALKLERVVLVGHSMGAQIAMTAVLQSPQLAQKLVLLAPAGFETFTDQERAWFQMVYTPAILKATTPEQIRKNFELNFFRFPADAEFMIQDRLIMRETPDYDAYCQMIPRCVMGMLHQPVFDKLPQIQIPALVIYGEQDALIPNRILHKTLTTAEVAQAGAARLPAGQLKWASATGHFVQWEGADQVNRYLLDFLK